MNDLWVVNASPVIVLATVGRLALLESMCTELLIPESVVAEILAGPPADPARRAIEDGWGSRVAVECIAPDLLEWGLGMGETAVLAMALDRKPATVVLDDAAARTAARVLGIEVLGTVGVILRAKRRSVISSAADILKSLQAGGLWLNDDMIRSALKGVGEAWD